MDGALIDELVLVTGLAALLETNLRAEPHAIDASPSGAVGCVAPITQEAWLALYELTEEKRRARRTRSRYTTCFEVKLGAFIPFLRRQIYEPLGTVISLLQRVTREGKQARRLLVLVDSRVVLGAVLKGRSSSRKVNFFLRKLWFWCFSCDIVLE